MNWSFSKLMTWERCARRYKYRYVDKIPEPPRDPENDPLARGNRVHEGLEHAVKKAGKLPREADKFRKLIEHAAKLYQAKQARVEENWFLDDAWQETVRELVWLWVKLDLGVLDEEKLTAIVVDYKTGKSKYKMLEHIQQGQLYAIAVAILFPWVQHIIVEFWYIDENDIKQYTYTRERALSFMSHFQRRADALMNDRFFSPRPNNMNCKWCPYGKRNGNGHCPASLP